MANLYNSDITTRVLEPANHSNNRTEFRLDNDSCYLSNLRLINVGGATTVGADDQPNANLAQGPRAVIRQIELYSGNQLLDQIVNFNDWDIYKAILSSNDKQQSAGSPLRNTNWGFTTEGEAAWADPIPDPPAPAQDSYYTTARNYLVATKNLPAVADPKKQAWVSLQEVFAFLNSSIHLPTGILKDLRLVVIYNSATQLNKLTDKNDITSFVPSRPLLVADEINPGPMFDSFVKSYRGVNYTPVEGDRVMIPEIPLATLADGANTNNIEKASNHLLSGFTGKYVEKLVLMTQGTVASTWEDPFSRGNPGGGGANVNNANVGGRGSSNQWKQSIQWRVNGANKLPRTGLTGHNRTLAMLADNTPGYTNVPASNWVSVQDPNEVLFGDRPFGNYVCVPIEETISELQLAYIRYGLWGADVATNASTRQALEANVFGLVRKSLMVRDNGTFVVMYA